jgi:hypothetical protein
MDYARFSKTEFDNCGLNTEEVRVLADSLQDAVANELQSSLLKAFQEVIRNLNEQGHALKPQAINIGDIGYLDETKDGSVQLRLGIDLVVSAGYSHLYSEE